jgi:hypothetical protein
MPIPNEVLFDQVQEGNVTAAYRRLLAISILSLVPLATARAQDPLGGVALGIGVTVYEMGRMSRARAAHCT